MDNNTSSSQQPAETTVLPGDFPLPDEWANYLTHGFAFLLSLVGLFFITQAALVENNLTRAAIMGSYALSLVLLYGASTLYHYSETPNWKKKLRIADHCAIYLFIAGSYTPFTLLLMGDQGGVTLFSIIWVMAFSGIFFKIFFIHRFQFLSVIFYLSMGWMVIFSMQTFFEKLPSSGLYLLIAGGLFYTIGVIFYLLDKRPYFHAIWHLFTLGGSLCHYFCIFLYV